jgi:tripartite-type tricarboxylate transporter receptor subunit TctC
MAKSVPRWLYVRQPMVYTLLLANTSDFINATLYEKLNYDIVRDIAPVAGIIRTALVMEVHPSLPVRTVPEFIAYAKANPGKINMGSGGIGTPQHVSGELFKMMTGVSMVHVPYRGSGPMLTDFLGGQVQVAFDTLPSSIEHIRGGKLIPLAVTTATRSEVLPDIPTVGDFLPGYEASSWSGVCVPKNAAAEVIDRLNKEIDAGLADPKLKASFHDLGAEVFAGSPSQFAKIIAEDTEKWGKVIRAANIKVQ